MPMQLDRFEEETHSGSRYRLFDRQATDLQEF